MAMNEHSVELQHACIVLSEQDKAVITPLFILAVGPLITPHVVSDCSIDRRHYYCRVK